MPRNPKRLGELPARLDEAWHQAASPNVSKVTILEVQDDDIEQADPSHNNQYRLLMEGFKRQYSVHEHRVEKLLSKSEQRLARSIADGFAKASTIPVGPGGMPPHIDMFRPASSPDQMLPGQPLPGKTLAHETRVYDVPSDADFQAPAQLPNAEPSPTDSASHNNKSEAKAPQESEESGNDHDRPSSRNKRAWEPSESITSQGPATDQMMTAPSTRAQSPQNSVSRGRGPGFRQSVFTNKVGGVKGQVEQINAVAAELKNGKGFLRTASSGDEQGLHSQTTSSEDLDSMGRCGRADMWMKWIIMGNTFELISCFFIVLNAFFLGAQLEFELSNPGEDLTSGYRILNVLFVVIFTLELVLRIYAAQLEFFQPRNANFGWNMFDTLLVLLSITEEVLAAAGSNENLGAVRVFRTLRIVRSFRIIRMFKVFKDLRIMLAGVVYSLRSLVWAGLLLSAIMYLTAVCLGQYASEEIAQKTKNPSDGVLSEQVFGELKKYYGSLFQIIYTLFTSICGGVDWADAADPMMKLGGMLGFIFIFYISFAILCVLNIITGVFVENANRMTAKDDEMVLLENMEKRKHWFEEVAELFKAADTDSSGRLDGAEFALKMKDYRMQAWLQKIGVQVESYSAEGLFALLDFDGDGWLDLDEFAVALQSVHGPARSIDLAKVNKDTRQLRKEMTKLNQMCSQIIDLLGYAQASEC